MPAAAEIRAPSRLRRVLLIVAGVLVLLYALACLRVVQQEDRDETQAADAIVVFGAAEYAGHPSPVLRARLDHALLLYQRGLAPYIIVTGGAGEDPHFSEGGVGRDYLVRRGVPENRVIAETQSRNTREQAERVAAIMRTNRMASCIAVSDAYHIFRAKAALERQGMTAYGAPRPEQHYVPLGRRILTVMREAVSFCLWKLHLV